MSHLYSKQILRHSGSALKIFKFNLFWDLIEKNLIQTEIIFPNSAQVDSAVINNSAYADKFTDR